MSVASYHKAALRASTGEVIGAVYVTHVKDGDTTGSYGLKFSEHQLSGPADCTETVDSEGATHTVVHIPISPSLFLDFVDGDTGSFKYGEITGQLDPDALDESTALSNIALTPPTKPLTPLLEEPREAPSAELPRLIVCTIM